MSHMAQGFSFNPLVINNEVCGSSEQTLFNDFSKSWPHRNKFVSSIDHYSSNCFVPPGCKIPSAAAVPNLFSPNEIRSSDELQTSSVNHYLPFDKPQQAYAHTSSFVAANQSTAYFGANEVGFSNLFSLEYTFPDYGDFGSTEQLSRVEHIDQRKRDSSLPFHSKQSADDEKINPQEFVLRQEHLTLHEPYYTPLDPSLPHYFCANEMNSFAYSCLTSTEPSCQTSDYKLSLSTRFHKAQNTSVNFIEETRFDQRRSTSSETNTNVKENYREEKIFTSNPTKHPVSGTTPKNDNVDCLSSNILSESESTDVYKEEILNQPGSLPNEAETSKVVLKEEKLDFGTEYEEPNIQENSNCSSNIITNKNTSNIITNKNTLPVKSESKQSFNPASLNDCATPNQNLTLEPQDLKKSNISSINSQNRESFSKPPTSISRQRAIIREDPAIEGRHEFDTSRDRLVECDSTTESNLQPTDLSSNALHSIKLDADNPSDLGDQPFSEAPKENNIPSKCRICKEFLLTEKPLSQQFSVPIDANYDVCNACNICFLQKSVLSTNSLSEKNQHRCLYCDRDFKKECYLTLHLKTHSTERPFKCSKCNKTFTNSAKLKLHSKTHYVYKPFSCSECGKRFLRNSHLKMHMKVHLGNKPFKCEVCLKDFESRSKLSDHEKYHSPKLPFKCTTCEKSFVKKTYFESHLRIHCDAKPFECSMCKTWFAQKSVLRQHTKNCRFSVPHQKF